MCRRFEVDAWVWWCQNVTHLNRCWKYACIKKYYPLMLSYLQNSMLKFIFEGFKDLVLKAFLKIIFLDSILVWIHHFLCCCQHVTICCPHAAILSIVKYICLTLSTALEYISVFSIVTVSIVFIHVPHLFPCMLAHEALPHISCPLGKLNIGRRFWMVISYFLNMVSYDCVGEH